MATEFLREKINSLNNLILQEALQVFQHQLLIDATATSTGDPQIDAGMKENARQANVVVTASSKRLGVYRAKLAELTAELNAVQQPAEGT